MLQQNLEKDLSMWHPIFLHICLEWKRQLKGNWNEQIILQVIKEFSP